jgi:hypothetical protein
MNCLESRRRLLAAPRERNSAHEEHLVECGACTKLMAELVELDRSIERAAAVAVPEALAHRVLLKRRPVGGLRYALAASFAAACLTAAFLGAGVVHAPGFAPTAEAVGPSHPAIAAIAQVADEDVEGSYVTTASSDSAEIEQGLKRLGLTLKPGAATAYYVGKCHLSGSGPCERIVLSTPDAHANVMLVPDYPVGDRVLVSDRRMTALVNPAAGGGYIVVADSARTAKRLEKLLVKG